MKKALLAVTLLLFWASFAVAQRSGVPSFVATESHEEGVLNLATLTPSINITLLAKGQGALPGSITLSSPQSCQFVKEGTPPVNATACGNLYHLTDHTGYLLAYFNFMDNPLINMGTDASGVTVGSCTTYTIKHLVGIDTVSAWSIPTTTLYYPSTCGNGTTTATVTTNDGSGITATLTSQVSGVLASSVSNASGWVESTSVIGAQDPFGNQVSYQSTPYGFVDTLGAVTTLANTYGGGFPYGYTDTTGTSQSITATNGTATTFQNSSCGTGWNGTSVTPISSINFPDSTKISFTWDTNGTGIDGLIKSVTLRTGGTITYTYGTQNCGNATPFYFSTLSRATADGTWTYTIGTWTSGSTTTVLDPGKNKVVYQFYGSLTAANTPLFTQSVTRYQNTGSVGTPAYTEISSETYCYNTSCTAAPTLPITTLEIKSYLGSTPTFMSDETKTFDNTYGLLKTDATTDEITSQTITTTYVYGTDSSGTCVAITNTNIQDHPCTITTKNGTTWLSGSTYSYNSNGALTSSSACLSSTCTGSSALTTTYTPTTHGTYSAIQGPNGQTVNYTYGSCNSLMPTDITTTVNSVAIDHKATWNCDAGLVVDTTDANSNEDDTTYDSMNRPSTHVDRLENTTNFGYGSPTLNYAFIQSPLSVRHITYVDGLGRTAQDQIRQSSSSSNYDTVSYTYGWIDSGSNALTNFQVTTSVPCVALVNNNCSTTALTSLFNPIAGPVKTTDYNSGTGTYAVNSKDFSFTAGPAVTQENTKVVQTEVDGFGRVTSTCALEASGGTSCGQTMGNSGILTSNVYSFATGAPKVVTTRGSQSHTTIADAIGRTSSVQTPEAGTVTYTYDSIASGICNAGASSSAGDLVETVDAASNKICMYYEGLHRLTDIDNNNESSTNPCRRFRYDSTAAKIQTAPTGYPSSGNNIIGRMFEAETDNCVQTMGKFTAITDEWFAYDKMGRMTDMWELSPNSSSNYRHTTVAYDADGVPTSLSGAPNVSTVTYTTDGEERWNTAKFGTTTIVSAVTYDAASRATEIDIGAGTDKDTYSFDNVGNMTQYQFFVGSANNKGVLTWSSIGSLRQLAITDGLNSNNTQTCKFGTSTTAGYDDVGRILDDDCGTVWAQTYSYDQYDNLTKAGSISWNPGYVSTNNQFNNGATYDSNGNITKDTSGMGANTYTWNVYGKMASENSTTASYDAFDRLVAYGSSNEYIYGPLGKIGAFTSGSPYVLRIPAPGGGLMEENSSGVFHYYHNDWRDSTIVASSVPATGNGVLDWSRSFSSYGDDYNNSTNDMRFAGIDDDTITGITFSTPTRELAKNAGRWLSPDPAHSGWNAYAYVTDPNTQIDPSGLRACNSSDQACVIANQDDVGSSLAVAMQIYCINGCEGFGSLIFNSPNRSGVTCVLCGMPEGATLGTMNVGGNWGHNFVHNLPGFAAGIAYGNYLLEYWVMNGTGMPKWPFMTPGSNIESDIMQSRLRDVIRRGASEHRIDMANHAERMANLEQDRDMWQNIHDTGGSTQSLQEILDEGGRIMRRQTAEDIVSGTMRGLRATSPLAIFVLTNVQETANELQDTTNKVVMTPTQTWGEIFACSAFGAGYCH